MVNGRNWWILSQGKSVSSFDVRWSYLIFGSLILIQIIPMECTHDKDPCYTQHIWRICLNRFLESLTTEFSENTSNTRYDCHYQWGPDVLLDYYHSNGMIVSIVREIHRMVEWLVSESMVIYYIHLFRDSTWPGGELAKPAALRTEAVSIDSVYQ